MTTSNLSIHPSNFPSILFWSKSRHPAILSSHILALISKWKVLFDKCTTLCSFSYNNICLTNTCQNRFGLKFNMLVFSHIKWILSLGITASPFHLYQNKLPLNIPKVNSKFPFRQFRSVCTLSNPEIKELWSYVLQLSPFEVLCSDTSDNSITQVSRDLSGPALQRRGEDLGLTG